ncbi:hypothetical protein FEM48_Zijuj12G0135100 [Ziziphus jujuba var. spinosa]|uniref:J domain-containing protein n=1 Tax=Ziziphus jujuba var. spinosa TaxID=714518 RepID=A0A978UDL7_ZIZJJ|nr:hypothetical protein FEM48_Zijuj12G0135100 [Ziziphus jujuba var. spinosa]
MIMQSQLLVGPIPINGCFGFHSGFQINPGPPSHSATHLHHQNRVRHHRRWSPLIVAASSSWAIPGEQNHYAVLGLSRYATSAEIKRAYRLLARKTDVRECYVVSIFSSVSCLYMVLVATEAILSLVLISMYHPDVSKVSQAGEVFKSIRHAYEVLSNEATRTQYDQALKLQEDTGRQRRRESYSTEFDDEFDDGVKVYRWEWAELRWRMQQENYWEGNRVNEGFQETSEVAEEENSMQERGSFIEVLRSAFMSLLLLQTFGSRFSLTFSSLMALLDRKLDAGYKIGYIIAWILGGRGGVLLTLCLSFASWVCGKTSSSMVVLVVVAMWVGSNLARYAPLPQGALLTLLYMSIKLQVDLN